jgi:hypothetical protein
MEPASSQAHFALRWLATTLVRSIDDEICAVACRDHRRNLNHIAKLRRTCVFAVTSLKPR